MLVMARTAPSITLGTEERKALEGMVRASTTAQRDVLRARIVLMAAEGQRNDEIQASLGVSKPVVIKWRGRFARSGLEGLADQGGRGRKRRHDAVIRHRIAATACSIPPESVGSHWSVRSLAKHLKVSAALVQDVLAAESIQPHRVRYWKHSDDPEFEPKMLSVVGLYLNPPENGVVLSVDEKTSIQALDRTQPRLPLKPHQVERLSHEYKRNGTASLLAALECTAARSAASPLNTMTATPYPLPASPPQGLSPPGPLPDPRQRLFAPQQENPCLGEKHPACTWSLPPPMPVGSIRSKSSSAFSLERSSDEASSNPVKNSSTAS